MENRDAGPAGPAAFLLLAFLLVFAPLVLGGNRPLPLLVLELAAVAGIAALAWQWPASSKAFALPAPLLWGAGLLVLYPLLQLVPMPFELWSRLPGRAPYVAALEFAGDASQGAMRPVSIHPRATEYSWLVMLPCVAAFLLARAQSRRTVRKVVVLFVAVAVCEALLGIVQLGASPGSPLYLGNTHGGGATTGTYVNRNHFAALMAMALPSALVLWFLATRTSTDSQGDQMRVHPAFRDRWLATQIALLLPTVFLVVALLFSLSRGGIGAGLLALSLASLALVPRAHSSWAKLGFGVIAAGAIAFAAYIGLTPVLDRFAPDQLSVGYEGRLQIAAAAVRGGLDFLPFGSGLGTFADAFPRYQVEGLPGFVDHAHNDYAELFLELGVAGVAVVALLGAAYVARWIELARARGSRSLDRLQLAAGLGMLAMLVHGAVDFNFHIPANAIYFSFLAGIFFRVDPVN